MLWGAFNNASSAMTAMSVDMGSISQNIANVNTTGYKRTETLFKTVMSESHASPNSYVSGLNIFGVQTAQRNLIQAQGVITPSTTWSDLAINGRGFFMVAPPVSNSVPSTVDLASQSSVLYTRDGSWQRTYGPDTDANLARSYFTTSSGNYLLGWMADDTGAIPSNARLQPVYTLAPRPIANNGTEAVDPTATVLPTSQTMPGRTTTSASVRANLPATSGAAANSYTSTMKVTDPNGDEQTMTLNWARNATDPTQWTVTYSLPNATVTSGTLALTGGIMNVSLDSMGNLIGQATDPAADPNTDSSIPANIVIDWDDATYGATTASTTQSVNVSSMGPSMQTEKIPLQVYDDQFYGHTVNLSFERTGTNTWNMYVLDDANNLDTTLTPVAPIEVSFDGNGKLITPTGDVALSLSWTGTHAGSSSFSLSLDNLTQYKDKAAYIGTVSQDGYARGTLMATSFNEMGELRGYFDNGQNRVLFKVPVATFTAENSLNPISGNLFQRTAAAGDLTVGGIDEVPGEGRMVTSSLETSTVSIEDEFTRMIMTQKAYSTNAQVFKTADEMTTLARDLKR